MPEFLKNLKDHKTSKPLSADEYFSIPYYSASRIKEYEKNPRLFAVNRKPEGLHESDENFSKDKTFGSLLHKKILEPKDWESKEKELLKLLTPVERRRFDDTFQQFRKNKQIQKIMTHVGVTEKVFIGKMKIELGEKKAEVFCKCRVDILTKTGWLVDLKTISSTDRISRHCRDYRYDLQMAFYHDLLKNCGVELRGVLMIFIEKSKPFECPVFYCSKDFLTRGRDGDEYCRGYKQIMAEMHYAPKISNFDDLQPL